MPRDSQGPERTQIATILQGNETEWYYNKKDCLLVNVPAKQKRGVATQSDCANKCLPARLEEEFYQAELGKVNISLELSRENLPFERQLSTRT